MMHLHYSALAPPTQRVEVDRRGTHVLRGAELTKITAGLDCSLDS